MLYSIVVAALFIVLSLVRDNLRVRAMNDGILGLIIVALKAGALRYSTIFALTTTPRQLWTELKLGWVTDSDLARVVRDMKESE